METIAIPKEVNQSLLFDILADNDDVTAGLKTINGKVFNLINGIQLITIFKKYIEFYENGGIKED